MNEFPLFLAPALAGLPAPAFARERALLRRYVFHMAALRDFNIWAASDEYTLRESIKRMRNLVEKTMVALWGTYWNLKHFCDRHPDFPFTNHMEEMKVQIERFGGDLPERLDVAERQQLLLSSKMAFLPQKQAELLLAFVNRNIDVQNEIEKKEYEAAAIQQGTEPPVFPVYHMQPGNDAQLVNAFIIDMTMVNRIYLRQSCPVENCLHPLDFGSCFQARHFKYCLEHVAWVSNEDKTCHRAPTGAVCDGALFEWDPNFPGECLRCAALRYDPDEDLYWVHRQIHRLQQDRLHQEQHQLAPEHLHEDLDVVITELNEGDNMSNFAPMDTEYEADGDDTTSETEYDRELAAYLQFVRESKQT
ncbi:hypothetical protein BDV95DRAFT_590365 [Massariosphaeria phaeospora]|uniref:Uncharacterized protein n=1 Tax=Massariosphaeria phaeospora TaxID=100035 RepID=A0A7C8ICM9_9PLEO|nr:hypothetical protein BDV95DRAFT_590365 [Massariosphaeria phaeospora]